MLKFIWFLVLVIPPPLYAWEFRPASLDHMSLDVAKFGCNREPMTPDIPCEDYRGRVRLNWNVGLLNDFLQWRNNLHGEGTDQKFTTLGWNYILAAPLPGGVELFMEHHSKHVLDAVNPTIAGRPKPEKFPVEDSIGVRVIFYQKGK